MKKRYQLLLLAFVLGCGYINSTHGAANVTDRFKTHSGTECERSHNSGKELELSVIADPETDEKKVMLTMTVEFGRGSFESQRINCQTTMLLEQDRMYLENERLKLELELLKRKVNGDPNAGQTSASSTTTDGDDW